MDRWFLRHRHTGFVALSLLAGLSALYGVLVLLLGPVSWQIAGSTVRSLRGTDRATAIDSVRQTVVTTAAGLAATVGLAFTARTFYMSRRGQVTDRYASAMSLLASDKLEERLGGIYALEHVMAESPRDHAAVTDVLAAFVREHAQLTQQNEEVGPVPPSVGNVASEVIEPVTAELKQHLVHPTADVAAAVTVLARRPNRDEPALIVNLRNVNLAGLWLPPKSKISRIDFAGSNLSHTRFPHAEFHNVGLSGVNLTKAVLDQSRFDEVYLTYADLTEAFASNTVFTHTILLGARLTKAALHGADLSEAGNLTAEQFSESRLDHKTKFPEELAHDAWITARIADCTAIPTRPFAPPTPKPNTSSA